MAMGWLGGMTKTSDRYARWFGTRVPLVSRGGIALLTFLGVLLISSIIYLNFEYTILTTNLWLVLFLFMLAGALLHIDILLLIRIRFSNPSTNADFLEMVSRIHQKVVLSPRIHIWVRQSNDVFIASTFNPLFDAIIVSEPMVDLILRSPESGEVLLAFHLFRVPRTRWFADFIGSIVLFLLLAYPSSLFLVPLAIMLVQSIMIGGLYVLTYLSSFATIFMAPFLLIFLIKGTFWRHEPAFDSVQEIYGMHPQVAKVQVEKGVILDEEEAQTIIWGIRDWEKSKRGARRVGVCTIAGILSWLLGFVPLFAIGYIPYYSPLVMLMYLPYIFAAAGALVAYLLLRKWDKNAIGEVFKKTTDYDEPIWAD
jgi:hypothetical protein